MTNPCHYKTLSGLLKATERALRLNLMSRMPITISGMSFGMWISNAKNAAEKFNAVYNIAELIRKYSITRINDLKDGGYGYAIPLNIDMSRGYIKGDVIPGYGEIEEIFETQYKIGGQYFHKRIFNQELI